MADNLQVKILVDAADLKTGMSSAADAVETATARMNTSFSRVGPEWEEATHEAAFSTREAREAVRGLGEEIGVHMPRFVSTFVSDLGGVGPALAAAFSPIAVIGLAKVLYEAGKAAFEFYDNVVNLRKELEALDELEQKLTDDMISLSNSIVQGNVKLAELTGGPIVGAKTNVALLGQEITDLGKLMDVNGKQFKELGLAAKSSLREFLIPTQASEFADTLTRVGLEIKRVQSLLLNTEEGTTEYKSLQEALSGLSAFYDVLALKVERFNQEVKIAAAEQANAEKDAADKALREAQRLEKEEAAALHRHLEAEVQSMERIAREEIRILSERAKENREFDRNLEAEIKKKDEEIVRSGQKALEQAVANQDKALKEEARQLKQAQKPWLELGRAINSGLDTMLRGVLQGTQTVGQAFARLGSDLILVMAEALAKVYLQHLAHWIAVNVLEKIHMTRSIGILIEGASKKQAVQTEANTGSVVSDAGVAGAAAFASVMEALPFPENVATAPGVMADAIGTTLSNLSLTSAAGGLWQVGSDQFAMIHKNESILPAGVAGPMRDFFSGGGKSSGAVHIHIHAIDTQTGADFLRKHADVIASEFRRRTREFR